MKNYGYWVNLPKRFIQRKRFSGLRIEELKTFGSQVENEPDQLCIALCYTYIFSLIFLSFLKHFYKNYVLILERERE